MKKKRNRHSWEHDLSKNNDGEFICLIDNKTFMTHNGLDRHLKNKHNKTYYTYLIDYNMCKTTDFLKCEECGQYVKSLSVHIKQHNLSKDDYIKKYNYEGAWVCESTNNKLSELTSGENNPMHHSKTTEEFRKSNSPFSSEFYLKRNPEITSEKAEEMVKEFAKNALDGRLTETQFEYWLKKCDGNEKKAKELYKDRQATLSLPKCIEKYGTDEGTKIWNQRQDKWQKSLLNNGNLKHGCSSISQELFNEISKHYNNNKNIKYTSLNGGEFRIVNPDGYKPYMYDYTDINKMKIIEYNGDKYHANPKTYEATDYPHPFKPDDIKYRADNIWKRDELKNNIAKSHGYDVLVIWDSEYKKNKESTIKKCLEFLES